MNSSTTKTKSKERLQRGMIISNKMDKTITVSVNRFVKHPKYKKYFKKSKKFKVHDEAGQFKVGDEVTFKECRPLSKDKKFTVVI